MGENAAYDEVKHVLSKALAHWKRTTRNGKERAILDGELAQDEWAEKVFRSDVKRFDATQEEKLVEALVWEINNQARKGSPCTTQPDLQMELGFLAEGLAFWSKPENLERFERFQKDAPIKAAITAQCIAAKSSGGNLRERRQAVRNRLCEICHDDESLEQFRAELKRSRTTDKRPGKKKPAGRGSFADEIEIGYMDKGGPWPDKF